MYIIVIMNTIFIFKHVPHCKPAMKATPKVDISIDFGRSTSSPVKSANNCMMKLFLETPPSTLRRSNLYILIVSICATKKFEF